ncbi:hypothetical protein MS3_00000610 [Schistosoma haematobium]|uniref:Uncharacterized protein n=2 Tax=Schistosoma TaxID=6181 RepID=A0AA85BUS3_9TREM|nr:hypothetical protein MS3_00000610 [Schistosoma haematobium]CAH8450079.1 unnamed protein product [Schistosoma mattheei]KAH9581550.1 hypothetical protein MS3_00000610 [Schistosoma haematobium]CAH8517992.1 unnamed protein product [Schistosoma mattheei]CAH8535688.1 unnamed protein product [Schistosoma mattheei]CAH8544587.1 unnamed protein product [Schistosoma mattheei]
MTTFSDRLQLLLEQQQQCFKNSQLNFLENLRTLLVNVPCFGGATEVGKFISHLQTELENNCRTYEAVYKSLCESRTTSDVNETVIHGPPSCPEMSNSETFPVVGSNPTVPETCTDSDVPSSQEDLLLNAHKLIAVPAHNGTGNKSCGTLNPAVSNGPHHSTTGDSDESYYLDLFVPENVLNALNDDQKSNTILIDVDYRSDQLFTNEIFNKSRDNVPEESNVGDLISSDIVPHYLITFSDSPVQSDNYVLNKVKLILTWEYEDPTLFRGGG